MRVAVFNGGDRPITIERFDDPELRPHELRIEIARCGICGSDVTMTSGSAFDYALGCKLGHEYSGEVVEAGRAVSELKVGDRVACLPKAGCGACEACAQGRPLFCPTGPMLFGGFGDSIVVPQDAAFRLPQSIGLADGALVEPMACGLRALRMAGMRGGERVLVLGAGSMALAIVYWARVLGAGSILVASRSSRRNEVALAMGADAVHSFDEDDPQALARSLGRAPDIVAECVGKPNMLQQAVDHVGPGGTVICMGMCVVADAFIPVQCAFKEARMIFPFGYSVDQFEETIRVFDAGKVRPELMVSDEIALDDVPAVLTRMRGAHDYLKVLVNPKLAPSHD